MPSLTLCNPEDPEFGRKRDRANTEWHSLLSPAISKPRRWFQVHPPYSNPNAAANAAFQINADTGNGRYPPGRWEATSRKRNNQGILFVRYMGRS